MLHTEYVNNVKIIRIDHGRANSIDIKLLDRLITETGYLTAVGLIITGTDRFFSAGFNLREVLKYDHREMKELMYKFHFFQIGLLKAAYPVVAAINGHCIAGGYIMALNCDFRVAQKGDYKAGLNEMVHGIILPPIATERIKQLTELSLIGQIPPGEILPADQAYNLGLVDRLVNEGKLIEPALDFIHDFNMSGKQQRNMKIINILTRQFDKLYQPFLKTWFSPAAKKYIAEHAKRLNI